MKFRFCTISAVFAVMLFSASCALAQQNPSYPSTTTITAASIRGQISGTINSSWDNSCLETYYLPTYSTTIDGNGVDQTDGPTTPSFDSQGAWGYVYGPGSYLIQGQFSGFSGTLSGSGGQQSCEVTGSSGTLTLVIPAPVASTTQLAAPSSVIKGQTAGIIVTVCGNYNVGPSPSGAAALFYGSTVLASTQVKAAQVSPGSPICSAAAFNLSTAGVPVGTYSITAVYNGDSNLSASSSSAATVSVTQPQPGPTTAALAVSPTTLTSGQPVTLTANVTSTSGITPTGTVTFLYGTLSLGTAKLNGGTGTLVESSRNIPGGVYAITARYNGDSYNYSSTSPAQNVTVQNTTTTALSANPTTVTAGQSVAFTATVTRTPASGAPAGKVNFSLSGYTFASASLNAQGTATVTFSTKNLVSGTYNVTATYAGDTLDVTSASSPVTITVQ